MKRKANQGFDRVVPASQIEANAGVIVFPRVDTNGKPASAIAINTRSTAGQFRLPGGEPHRLDGYGVAVMALEK